MLRMSDNDVLGSCGAAVFPVDAATLALEAARNTNERERKKPCVGSGL